MADELKKEITESTEDIAETAPAASDLTEEITKTADNPDAEAEASFAKAEEDDEALERFLSREQKEKKPAKPASKKKPLFILIGVVLIVAILVLALILLRGNKPTVQNETSQADLALTVSDNGMHEANVAVDEDGNIKQNGIGSIITNVPADIKQIDVENEDGSFRVTSSTLSGEATVYTVVGLEDYDLQEGIADEIANHGSHLDFIRVISVDANLEEFGLDKPRATVTVTYNDDTTAVFRVGNNAAGEDAGTYLSFGTGKTVFLVSTEDITPFLYSVNQFISLTITDTVTDSENSDFEKLTLTGTHFDEPIVIEPNKDDANESAYLVTEPRKMFPNAVESSDIAGDIRGLYAESVVCVNPSDNQLSSYGLSEPYAKLDAVYPDVTIQLIASAPGDDGTVKLYNPDKKVVYSIQLAAVCWAKTNMELLLPENPLRVRQRYVSEIAFSAGSTDFTLDVSSTTENITDDSGTQQEVTDTTASYNGKELNTDNFNIFIQNLNAITNQGLLDQSKGSEVMRVTFRYSTDRADDTLIAYAGDATHYILTFNGEIVGSANKSYMDKLIQGADNLIKGETVDSL